MKKRPIILLAGAAISLGLAGSTASGITSLSEVHVPGFGWIAVEDGGSVSDELQARAASAPARNLSLAERAADAAREAEAVAQRPEALEPFADEGPEGDVAAVKAAVESILREDLALQAGTELPADADARLARIYSADTVGQQRRDLERGLALGAGQPDLILTGSAVVLEEWDGVRVTGDRAVALASGRERYIFGSGRERLSRHRYQMHLVREEGVWKQEFLFNQDLDLA